MISASTAQLAGDLRNAARLFEGFKKDVEGSTKDLGSAKAIAKEVDSHRRAAHSVSVGWKNAAGFAKAAFAGAIGGGFVLGGMVALEAGIGGVTEAFQHAKEAVNLAAELEQTTLAFEVMLKSSEKATKMLTEIRKFGAETPFNNAELTDSARKLIAYGLAADQVVPTLRMLGDVSAATQTPISDLSYLYGTLAAQQRAYSRDIYQFANRGIPIYEELAKVLKKSVAETRDLVEEGKVGFPEVAKAFKSMTEGRGLYAGLTARQGDTFAGVREQMTDALQQLKTKVGQVLIDELGLKEAAKDFAAVASKLESATPKIREAVRFVGELGRGGAQVAYEFSKAGAALIGMQFEGLANISPNFRKFVDDVKAFTTSLKDMKVDEVQLAQIGVSIFKGIAGPLADMADWVNTDGKQFADGFHKNFIDPLKEFIDVLDKIQPNKIGKTVNDAVMTDEMKAWSAKKWERHNNDEFLKKRGVDLGFSPVQAQYAVDVLKATDDMPFFNAPRADEPADQVRQRFAHLQNTIQKGETLQKFGVTDFDTHIESLKKQRGEFLRPYSDDPGGHFEDLKRFFDAGLVPHRRAGWKDGELPPGEGPQKTRRQKIDEYGESFLRDVERQKQMRLEAEEQARRQKQVATDATNSFAALAGGAGFAAKELSSIKVPDRPEVPWAIPAEVQDAAKRAKESFKDPVKEFIDEWNNLSQGLLEGVIKPDVYDRASADLIRRTEGLIGQGPYKLPDAAMQNTVESTRILNQWQADNGMQDTRTLLQRLVDFAARNEAQNAEIIRKSGLPLIVSLPK